MFDRLSEDLGGFREKISHGAFRASLGPATDIKALYDHQSSLVLGRTTAGTLRIKETGKGLRVSIDPPRTTYAADMLESIRRGDVSQMSFGFSLRHPESDTWDTNEHGDIIRTLVDVELHEVSIVAFPAYPDTSVGIRRLERWRAGGAWEAEREAARARAFLVEADAGLI